MIRTYIVTVHHDGETPETFDEIVLDELTNPLSTFIANWSAPANPAWGRRDGYEGPFIVGVIVHAVRPVGGDVRLGSWWRPDPDYNHGFNDTEEP